MPNLPWRASGVVPPSGDHPLDVLLTNGQLPPDAAPGLEPIEEVLAALRAGPSASEFAGKARAMAEFHGSVGLPRRPVPAQPWSLVTLRQRAGFRFAAAAAAVVAGAAAVAYTGSLPAPLQKAAHIALAAPAAHVAAGVPDGTGRRDHGLCNAYPRASQHGRGTEQGAAFRRLQKAVGNVAAHCRTVPHAGAAPGSTGLGGAGTSAGRNAARQGHPAGKSPHGSLHQRLGVHSGHDSGHLPRVLPGSVTRGWPGPSAGQWPGSSAGVAPRLPAAHGARPGAALALRPHTGQAARSPHARHRPSGGAMKRPARARTALSPRAHVPSHREAACGSAPGTQRSSQSHPPDLSGQNGGC